MNCWNVSSEITEWMLAKNKSLDDASYYEEWAIFQEKARKLLVKANNDVEVPGILWTSGLMEEGRASKYVDKNKYIVQIWAEAYKPLVGEVLQEGYKVIFSNKDAMYLDCGVAWWVGKGPNSCSPYKGWQDLYDNDLYGIAFNATSTTLYNGQILGGEAAIWSESADDETMDAKVSLSHI